MQPSYAVTLAFVQDAFAGVTDYGGKPYWTHCERVAQKLTDPDEQIAGLLHDIVEDTRYTLEDLRKMGYNENVLEMVRLVTRDKSDGLTYINWVRSIVASGNTGAMRLKLADNQDNADPVRNQALPPEKQSIIKRYNRSMAILKEGLKHPRIYSPIS